MTDTLTIRRPDDWHLHLRDGAILSAVLPATSAVFGRAIVMPNLVPPVVTAQDAAEYRDRILSAKPRGSGFRPLMTLYLTEGTEVRDVRAAAEIGLVTAVKLYPAGATTNSDSGVRDISRVSRVLETMAQIGLPLCVHGEVTDPDVDIFDREAIFIETVLDPLRRRIPELRVVLEHVTTKDGVDYIAGSEKNLAGTITVHHLVLNRSHILAGGIRPHYYCLPIAKRERHRLALRRAATSGDPRFFLGTDSAPHVDAAKESACGCAGCYTAPVALPLAAHVFDEEQALDRLEDFASSFGPAWYRLPANEETVTLARGHRPIPAKVETPQGPITVFDPGFPLAWHITSA
jgi:dihydroorotase